MFPSLTTFGRFFFFFDLDFVEPPMEKSPVLFFFLTVLHTWKKNLCLFHWIESLVLHHLCSRLTGNTMCMEITHTWDSCPVSVLAAIDLRLWCPDLIFQCHAKYWNPIQSSVFLLGFLIPVAFCRFYIYLFNIYVFFSVWLDFYCSLYSCHLSISVTVLKWQVWKCPKYMVSRVLWIYSDL